MKRFMLTAITAAMTLVGCQLQQETPTAANYQAPIAVAMGMAALGSTTPDTNVTPVNKVKRSQCTVCNGTGKTRSGDGIMVLDCDNCVPDSQLTPAEVEEIRDSLKKLGALERYQDKMENWVKNDMENYVLASVKRRTKYDATLNPANIPSKLDKPEAGIADPVVTTNVGGPTTTTATSTARVVRRRGWFGRRRGYTYVDNAVASSPGTVYTYRARGSCANGACSY